jgi:hypothetical protein
MRSPSSVRSSTALDVDLLEHEVRHQASWQRDPSLDGGLQEPMHAVHDHTATFGVAQVDRAIEIGRHRPCPLFGVRFRIGSDLVGCDHEPQVILSPPWEVQDPEQRFNGHRIDREVEGVEPREIPRSGEQETAQRLGDLSVRQ